MEKNSCTPINPKKYSCYGLKLKFMKEFDNEKKFPPRETLVYLRELTTMINFIQYSWIESK